LGKKDTSVALFLAGRAQARYVAILGLGQKRKVSQSSARAMGADIAKIANSIHAADASIVFEGKMIPGEDDALAMRAIAEGVVLGNYKFTAYKTKDDDERPTLKRIKFLTDAKSTPRLIGEIQKGIDIASCQCRARDLVNTPGADATPSMIAREAEKIAKRCGLSITVLDEAGIKKERMGCLIAVSKGSAEPPRFVRLEYRPKKPKGHLALVGKGITFDAGGISLKPPKGMEIMKDDMSGGAAIMYAMEMISQLRPKAAVTALIPLAENMPDGKALKPGDIITSRSKKTIEIISTDAEGRLVLADAISYAVDLKPSAIVEISTLTGGAAYCCGELYTLAMGTDDKLMKKVLSAAKRAGEYMWELPIVEEYMKGYTSGIADLNNSGKSRAQTILGALFLKEFACDIPFVHLDIAAVSTSEDENSLIKKGGTGVMVRTLVNLIENF
jgi:leucyl aminopeptidase